MSLVKFVIRFFDTLCHSTSLRKITIPWNTLRWSATTVILCACGIHILLSVRNANKHFWRRCRGSNRLKISLNSLVKFTSLSPLILAGLPLLSVSLWFLQSSVGPNSIYHITSTQIQKELGEFFSTRRNFLRIKVWQCQLQYPWLRRHSVNSQPHPIAISLLDWTITKALMALR